MAFWCANPNMQNADPLAFEGLIKTFVPQCLRGSLITIIIHFGLTTKSQSHKDTEN